MKDLIRRSNQKGTVIVESAISMVLFMMLLFGIIEGGRMVWTYNTLAYVAREGTRYATVRGSSSLSPATVSSIETYVKGRAVGLDPTKMTVLTTWTPNNSAGKFVQVVVNYQYSMSTTLFVAAPFQMTSTSRTVVLH
jgi:Flp pilus assembly protein TadG